MYIYIYYLTFVHRATSPGAQFTCFTGTEVQILTQKALVGSVFSGLVLDTSDVC